ncbi:hypothetical protein Bhyg_15613 [Pseudolycoriella hygida]|uniref:Uncharacterized protein n=1 Tax=Pseudolycoriella hygida TaxID=35572 RepID=A0A9Q0MN30_9DIPT|nr:hypothetical protein Bhyg_15613 [Pseudolycoriella hygida]
MEFTIYVHIKNFVFCMLLVAHLVSCDDSDKKINLEDIERDNLISERRSQSKEVLEGQHTQHIRPPSIHGHAATNYKTQQEAEDVSTNDITYSHQPTAETQYENHHQNVLQYVTVQPQTVQYEDEKEYESQPQSPPAHYRPVHEEGRTYSAPSRHSLTSPIIPTASATPSPYLAQQPQYVYVQAGQSANQPSVQSNAVYDHKSQEEVRYAQSVSYDQQQDVDATYSQASQTETEQSDKGSITYEHQDHEGATYSPQPQYIQYVPYISQGPFPK